MATSTSNTSFYADFASLSALKRDAKADGQKALRETAQQFESLFTQMMLKSMRAATPGDAISKSSEMDFYQGMYDQQLAVQLSKGKGMGLADMLVQQLTRSGMVTGKQGADDKTGATHTDKTSQSSGSPPALRQNIAFGAATTPATTSNINATTTSTQDAQHRETLTRLLQGMGATQASDQSSDLDALLEQALPLLQSRLKSSLSGASSAQRSQDATADVATTNQTGSVQPATAGAVNRTPTSRDEFVRELWPHAQQAASKLGVDASTLIAHAALETGWGKHVPCNADGSSSFNLFGIKAGSSWNGSATQARTQEVDHGLSVQRVEKFRSYASPAECFDDYASLLGGSSRYAAARDAGGDSQQFAQALQKGGYATDPKYASKLQSVIASVKSLLIGSAQVSTTAADSAGRGVS